jgi:hypothetical protein
MTEEQRAALEQLPVMELKAIKVGGELVTVLVDGDYDGEYLSGFILRVLPNGYVQAQDYRSRSDRYKYLHHFILPKKEGMWTHFINGNKLDCRSANLEYITPSTSAKLRKQGVQRRPRAVKDSDTAPRTYSKYRGVSHATTTINNKVTAHPYRFNACVAQEYIGSFWGEEAAARAYDKAAKAKWGDRAILNFPEEVDDG